MIGASTPAMAQAPGKGWSAQCAHQREKQHFRRKKRRFWLKKGRN
jgi:hypothetical protein